MSKVKEEPKCKTCGGSEKIPKPLQLGGSFSSGFVTFPDQYIPCPDCQDKPEASGIQETINNIQEALGDPKAPWYGSDIVAWVGDLIEEYKLRTAKIKRLEEALSKAKKMLE